MRFGVFIGAALMFLFFIVMLGAAIHGNLDSCRAANPGFDCGLGWVKAEPFK